MTRKEAIEYLKSEYDDAKCDDDKYMQEWAEALDVAIISLEVDEEYDEVLKILGRKEPADVAPVIHARWEKDNTHSIHCWKCSNCSMHHRAMYDYCPSCGAKMDKEE